MSASTETPQGPRPFSEAATDGCVALLRTLRTIPEHERLDAVACFVDAACKTEWMTKCP